MTDYETLTSRELDAIVAEKIMGLKIHDRNWPCWMECECGTWIAATQRQKSSGSLNVDCVPMPVYLVSEDPLIVSVVAEYSSCPVASKALRGKMRADGWRFALSLDNARCQAEFGQSDRGYGAASTGGDEEERAVALAALKCVDTCTVI